MGRRDGGPRKYDPRLPAQGQKTLRARWEKGSIDPGILDVTGGGGGRELS